MQLLSALAFGACVAGSLTACAETTGSSGRAYGCIDADGASQDCRAWAVCASVLAP